MGQLVVTRFRALALNAARVQFVLDGRTMTLTPEQMAAFEKKYGKIYPHRGINHQDMQLDAYKFGIAHAEAQRKKSIARDDLIQTARECGFKSEWIHKIPALPDFIERLAAQISGEERLREIDRALDDVEYSGHYENGIYALKEQIEALRKALSFYADESRYRGANKVLEEPDEWSNAAGLQAYRLDVTRDNGQIARTAIKEAGK